MDGLVSTTNLLFLLKGLEVTITIAGVSIALSLVIGTILGIARHAKGTVASRIAGLYVETVRNIPNLLFILGIRFLTPLKPIQSAILAFTIFTSAAIGEIVRGGLNSIGKGQWEAARSQGFSTTGALVHIVLPQAFGNIIPPLVSQFITVVKDTSFVWAVGIEELTGKGMILMGMYGSVGQVFLLFGTIAALYFILDFGMSVAARRMKASRTVRVRR